MAKLTIHGPEVQWAIRCREQFDTTTGSLWGDSEFPGGWGGFGRLSPENQQAMKDKQDRITFVVRSYRTPIAWHVDGEGWYMSGQKHSPTTSHHQNIVRGAIGYRHNQTAPQD